MPIQCLPPAISEYWHIFIWTAYMSARTGSSILYLKISTELKLLCTKTFTMSVSCRNNSRIPYHEFFSTKYFYGDYDILNPYIYKAVHPYIPDVYDIPPEQIHIKECKNYDAGFLADCMKDYVLSDTRPNQPCEINNHTADCYTVNKNTVNKFSQKHADIPLTRIFPYETIFSFLDNTANEYLKLLKKHHFLK